LEGNLSKEEKELEKMEKENLKPVKEVYDNLKEDKEVQKWIEKTKSCEWVKIIEGGRNE